MAETVFFKPLKTQSKSVTPTTSEQTIIPDNGFNGLSDVTVGAIQLQSKSISPTTSEQTVSPDNDKDGLSSVTVGAIQLQSKSVTPTTSEQTVSPDNGKDGLSSVTVGAIQLQSKSVTPTTSEQTVSPDNGKDGLSSVTVGAIQLQSKSVTPMTSEQIVSPDNGKDGLSSVTVGAIQLQSKNAYPTNAEQAISPDNNKDGLSSVVVGAVTTSNLLASNIKSGVNVKVGNSNDDDAVANITGTFASDATITPHDVMNGKIGYNGSVKIEGDLNYYTITMTGNTGSSSWAVDSSHVVTFTGDISSHPNLLKIVGITKIDDSWHSRYFIAAGYATAYSDDIFSYSVSGTTLSLTMRIYVDDSVNANTSMTFSLTYLGY